MKRFSKFHTEERKSSVLHGLFVPLMEECQRAGILRGDFGKREKENCGYECIESDGFV